MEYITLPTASLREWDKNPRSITKDNYERLKQKLQNKAQYKPLLVSANPDATFTVLAGNMRLRAYRDLGVENLWVKILEFRAMDDGSWAVFMDGVEQNERFQSREDAMMDWSLSENERAGYYDTDLLANSMDQYQLIWDNYQIDISEPMSIPKALDRFAIPSEDKAGEEGSGGAPKSVKCPNCGADVEV